jgi:hypothetical protein
VTTPPSSPPNGHLCREPAGAVKGAQRPVCGRTLDGAEDSRILAFAGWSASPQPAQTTVPFTLNQYRYISTNLKMKREVLKRFWETARLGRSRDSVWRPTPALLALLSSL